MLKNTVKKKRSGLPGFALTFTFILALLPLTVQADVLKLKDGRILRGKVTPDGDSLILKTRLGSIRIQRSQVKSWQTKSSKEEEFENLKKLLGNGTAAERYRLAVWARDNKLSDEAQQSFESVLQVNPDHEGARAALGYKRFQSTWLSERDFYKLKGMVRYRGRWMTPEEREKLRTTAAQQKEIERQLKALERARRELARQARRIKQLQRPVTGSSRSVGRRLGLSTNPQRYNPNNNPYFGYYNGYFGVPTGFYWFPWYAYQFRNGRRWNRPIIVNNPIVGGGSTPQRVYPYGGLNSHPSYYPNGFNRRRQSYGAGWSFDWTSKSGRTRISGQFGSGHRYRGSSRYSNGRRNRTQSSVYRGGNSRYRGRTSRTSRSTSTTTRSGLYGQSGASSHSAHIRWRDQQAIKINRRLLGQNSSARRGVSNGNYRGGYRRP